MYKLYDYIKVFCNNIRLRQSKIFGSLIAECEIFGHSFDLIVKDLERVFVIIYKF